VIVRDVGTVATTVLGRVVRLAVWIGKRWVSANVSPVHQFEVDPLALLVHGSEQVLLLAAELDRRLINLP